MIFGKLEDWQENAELKPFAEIFEYLAQIDTSSQLSVDRSGERKDISDGLWVRTLRCDTKSAAECVIETHREFIDLQFVFQGTEGFGVTTLDSLNSLGAYDVARDIEFYQVISGSAEDLPLTEVKPSEFVVFFPWDAHQPGRSPAGGTNFVVKSVFKLSFARWQACIKANQK